LLTIFASPQFSLLPGWEKLPATFVHRDVAGVAVDSSDRVYLATRSDDRVLVFDRQGRFLARWGEGMFARPHNITVGPDDLVYVADDRGSRVHVFTPDGTRRKVIGTGVPSDTGYDFQLPTYYGRIGSIQRGARPFNQCTKVAVAPTGDLFVADGYGNARVHRFTANGDLLLSWGEPGSGPGQFHCVHSVCVHPDGRVLVADRDNERIQVFDQQGLSLAIWPMQRPADIAVDGNGLIFVNEFCWQAGETSWTHGPISEFVPARLAVLAPDGSRLDTWVNDGPMHEPGNLTAPHGIAVDSRGDVYVAEVSYNFLGNQGLVPPDCHTLQKFARQAGDEDAEGTQAP
jgi:streptogramin lyase